MTPSRMFVNIVVQDPAKAAGFYQEVFGLRMVFESEWFVHLALPETPALELGLLRQGHDVLPMELRNPSNEGRTLLTLVVENTDQSFEKALAQGAECLQEPQDLFYGQRRAVVKSPDGTLIDISSPCPPDSAWLKRVSPKDGGYVESSS